MNKIGLKLWNINTDTYLDEAQKLYKKGMFDFIELYVVPNHLDKLKNWGKLDIPYIIHAPHFLHKMNLSDKNAFANNLKLYKEVKEYADELNAQYIVFHSGTDGDHKETARQLQILDDPRALIENKPYKLMPAIKGNAYVGAKFEEIEYIVKESGCGFCLDICHAICAANSFGIEIYDSIKRWSTLSPKLMHISDKDASNQMDFHLNIDHGTIDFKKIFNIIPFGLPITIETPKNYKEKLDDFVEDTNNLKKYIKDNK